MTNKQYVEKLLPEKIPLSEITDRESFADIHTRNQVIDECSTAILSALSAGELVRKESLLTEKEMLKALNDEHWHIVNTRLVKAMLRAQAEKIKGER